MRKFSLFMAAAALAGFMMILPAHADTATPPSPPPAPGVAAAPAAGDAAPVKHHHHGHHHAAAKTDAAAGDAKKPTRHGHHHMKRAEHHMHCMHCPANMHKVPVITHSNVGEMRPMRSYHYMHQDPSIYND